MNNSTLTEVQLKFFYKIKVRNGNDTERTSEENKWRQSHQSCRLLTDENPDSGPPPARAHAMLETIPCIDSEGALLFIVLPPEKCLHIPTCCFPFPNSNPLRQKLLPLKAQQQFLKTATKSGMLFF